MHRGDCLLVGRVCPAHAAEAMPARTHTRSFGRARRRTWRRLDRLQANALRAERAVAKRSAL